jgi:predicted signal transduction protein with EAL and GGDEF domain
VKNAKGFYCANLTPILLTITLVTLFTLFCVHCLVYYCRKARVCCYKKKPEKASKRMKKERKLAIKREQLDPAKAGEGVDKQIVYL